MHIVNTLIINIGYMYRRYNMRDMVEVTCYGTTKLYERQQAIREFRIAMQVCEGHEKERYTNIYCELVRGKKVVCDE